MVKKIDYKNFMLIFMWFLLVFSKVFQFNFLPTKYFYDSRAILKYAVYTPKYVDDTYRLTASFFRKINIFGFTNLAEWAIALTIIFSIVVFFIIKNRAENIDLLKFICIFCNIFLLGVYVFNISKDIIQLLFFLLAYFVIVTRIIKNVKLKLILCAGVFVYESVIFRSYYILVTVFSIFMFFLLNYTAKSKKQIRARNIIFIFLAIMITVLTFMIISSQFMPDKYNEILDVRSSTNGFREGSLDAVTMISDVLENNGNLFIWMINYVINAVRMMIPVELLFKGIKYIPFVIYQMFVLYYLILALKNLKQNYSDEGVLSLSVFIAYLLTSFTFEPDFGSWVRHEAATFPIFINVLNISSYARNKCNKNNVIILQTKVIK